MTSALGYTTDCHFDLILNPTGWLDSNIIKQAHVLLQPENQAIPGFKQPTLGPLLVVNLFKFFRLGTIIGMHQLNWMCAWICKPF